MKRFIIPTVLLVLFLSGQLLSKTWVTRATVPDLSHMSEQQKADYYLDERGEVDFEIYPDNALDLKPLVNAISIIHVEHGKVVANADRAGFEEFLNYNFTYEVQTPAWMTGPITMTDGAEFLSGRSKNIDPYSYPTYGAYVGYLEKWVEDFPELCKMYDLGPSGVADKNHRIYALRLSDNVTENECEPRYLETNTIHGDECLNFMNCLHMTDTLLNNYGSDDRITRLLDSLELWFVPNMNPDATYRSGDHTVEGAQRRNLADNFDLNRNNPCPCGAPGHIKSGLYDYWSKETEALMLLHSWYKFPFAQDQHGGTETYLWPYGGKSSRSKDEDWYKWFSGRLVAEIHDACGNNGYMTSCGGDGIGHIYSELYECHGIRCDMNDWVGNGKSLTLESSVTKMLNESKLKQHWTWCREALFQSMEILYQYGLHGTVVDSQPPHKPINKCKISRDGDLVQGTSLTDSTGRYVKYMNKGNYTLTFEHDSFVTQEIEYSITSYTERYNLYVKLWPKNPTGINLDVSFGNNLMRITPYNRGVFINGPVNARIGIYSVNGRMIAQLPVSNRTRTLWDGKDAHGRLAGNGCYVAKVEGGNQKLSQSFILNR